MASNRRVVWLGFALLTIAAVVVLAAGNANFDPVNYFSYFTIDSNLIATALLLAGVAMWRDDDTPTRFLPWRRRRAHDCDRRRVHVAAVAQRHCHVENPRRAGHPVGRTSHIAVTPAGAAGSGEADNTRSGERR